MKFENDDILIILDRCRGPEHGITGAKLAEAIGCDSRTIRHHIAALRMAGEPICGHPSTGYYLADTPADVAGTCAFLRSRAMTSLLQEARLKRISLPKLLGQLLIDFEPDPLPAGGAS